MLKSLTILATLAFYCLLGGTASAQQTGWQPATDCRANIRSVTCRVNPLTEAEAKDPRNEPVCLGGEAEYSAELELVYDELPAKLQKMFCHLRKIYIEEEFYATAYANEFREVFKDEEGKEMVRFNGNILGLNRKKIFDSKYSLQEWIDRKAQVIFGRKTEDPLLPEMPSFRFDFVGLKSNRLLMYVVIHEFGHLLDFANEVVSLRFDSFADCAQTMNANSPECNLQYAGLWSSTSWLPDGSIRPEDRYYADFRPCFYNCSPDQALDPKHAVDFYRSFAAKRSFVSTYASVNPMEDFAETFTTYMARTYLTDLESNQQKYLLATVNLPGEEPIFINWLEGRLWAKDNFMSMFDNIPWKYQRESEYSYPLELDLDSPQGTARRHACF